MARETEKDRTLSTWESSLREEREARLKNLAGDWREISEDSGERGRCDGASNCDELEGTTNHLGEGGGETHPLEQVEKEI